MRTNREYEIAWQGLKPGVHVYEYELNDRFFEEREETTEEFKDLDVQVTLKFDKKTNFFMCHFDVDGSATVPCDRCGEDFKIRLWDEFELLIKLTGDEDAIEHDEDADVAFIPHSETVLDISDWLYEFVLLSIPLQKVHPDKANGEPSCDPEALKLLNRLSDPGEAKRNEIWKGLDKLKEDSNKRKSK